MYIADFLFLFKVSLQKFKREAQRYADDPVVKRLLDTISSSEGRADFDVTPLMAALTKIFLANEGLAFLVSFLAPAGKCFMYFLSAECVKLGQLVLCLFCICVTLRKKIT